VLLRLEGVTRSFGGRELFRDVNLEVRRADRVGLVGPNGAGKTTLLRIAAGEDAPDGGARLVPRDVTVGMLRQEIDPERDTSVFDEVASALAHFDEQERELRRLEAEMERLGAAGSEIPAALAERYDAVRASFELGGGFERGARYSAFRPGNAYPPKPARRPCPP